MTPEEAKNLKVGDVYYFTYKYKGRYDAHKSIVHNGASLNFVREHQHEKFITEREAEEYASFLNAQEKLKS